MKAAIISLLVFLLMPCSTRAQIINPKKILEKKINKVLEKKAATPADSTAAEKTTAQKQDANNPEQEQADAKPVADTTPALQAYSEFDFVPGEKIIFFDDFSQDNTGDFPAMWFSNGSGEVVTLNTFSGKWLNLTGEGCYYPERDLATTENFTVEFDMICNFEEGMSFNEGFYVVSGNIKTPHEGGAIPGVAGVKTTINPWSIDLAAYADGNYVSNSTGKITLSPGQKIHLSYWIQKQRMRIYLNEKKVVDAPRILPAGYKYNILRFENGGEFKPFIGNFRVATGLPDTRNKLITQGKLVSYGIYFDVNKDVVKPESYGTLKEIATALNENATVRIKIYGHTDADGADAANLDLSKRRAAAVKNELVQSFGIEAGRIETDGKGEAQPVAANDTQVNKALNRRVEFIKL
jgi:OmpA-OmpF porin, OOP family